MERLSARQFAEWMSYERAFGPIDGSYSKELMAELHELIQVNNLLTGASLTKKGRKNPAGKFRRVPRPWRPDTDGEPEVDEDDEDEADCDDFTPEATRFDVKAYEAERDRTQTLDDNYEVEEDQ